MSRMNDIALDIQERLQGGQNPEYISKWLGIPIEWVYAELEHILESDEPLVGYISD